MLGFIIGVVITLAIVLPVLYVIGKRAMAREALTKNMVQRRLVVKA